MNNSMMMGNGQNNNGGNFSHKAPSLSTDLHCYFDCEQTFKKDFELHLHLKLKHRKEDPSELRRAYQAAEEEIALVKRSASTFQCQICPKILHEDGPFRKHILKTHNIKWEDYKEQYGRCEIESAPFECKICGRVVKYSRHTVHGHLTHVHNITWTQYLDRIRKMRHGQMAEELPQIETFDCRVCNVTVKFILKHLERVHKITEAEYFELYPDQTPIKSKWYKGMASKWTPDNEAGEMGYDNNMPMNQNFSNSQNFSMNTQMRGFNNTVQFPEQPLPTANPYLQSNSGPRNIQIPVQGEWQQQQTKSFISNNSQTFSTNQNLQGSGRIQQTQLPNTNGPFPNSNVLTNGLVKPPNHNIQNNNGFLKPPKADIQNPKNKNCSSCNTSFDSRKGFIEHCTSFHNMKFKTASGATISAQTISQKASQSQSQGNDKHADTNVKIETSNQFQPPAFKQEDESFEGPNEKYQTTRGDDYNVNAKEDDVSRYQENVPNTFNDSKQLVNPSLPLATNNENVEDEYRNLNSRENVGQEEQTST